MSNKYTKAVDLSPIEEDRAGLEDTAEGRRIVGVDQPPVEPEETVGTGGTAVYGGYIQDLDKDASLNGLKRYATYSDLLANVTIIATGVRFTQNLVSKAVWKVKPPIESGEEAPSEEAQRLADLTWEILNDMETPWHRVTRRASSYKNYGFSIQEWTAKVRDDGVIGFLDIEPRAQVTIERWDLDEHSRVLGVTQRSPQSQREIYLPRAKIVYLVDDALNDSPEGLGLFRNMVDAGRRLRRYLQLEGFGFEGDLRGIPLARAPLSDLDQMVKDKKITKERADELIDGMRVFLTKHIRSPQLAMMMDSKTYQTTDERQTPSNIPQWDVKLLDGGSYELDAVNDAIKRTMTEISRLFGVEHLMLGDGEAGSFALAKEKSQSFFLMVDNTLKEIAKQFEKDLIDPLWEMNGWDQKHKPELVFEPLASRDTEQAAAILRDLSITGVTLDRKDEAVQEILDQLGLTRLDPDIMDDMMEQLTGGFDENGLPVDADKPDGPDKPAVQVPSKPVDNAGDNPGDVE